MEGWASAQYVDRSAFASAQADGHARGRCDAIQQIINVTANDITENESD